MARAPDAVAAWRSIPALARAHAEGRTDAELDRREHPDAMTARTVLPVDAPRAKPRRTTVAAVLLAEVEHARSHLAPPTPAVRAVTRRARPRRAGARRRR